MKLGTRLLLPHLKHIKPLFVVSIVLGICATLILPYGFITSRFDLDLDRYASDQRIIKDLALEGLSGREASEKIFAFVSGIPHGVSRYSILENPVSELVEKLLQPVYVSEFVNTILEPHLLIARGSAICHQHALSMVLLAESQGIQGRVVWLDGHVVSELFFDGKWNLFDANKKFSMQDNQGQYQSVSEFIEILGDQTTQVEWNNNAREYAKDFGNIYLSQENNKVYRYYPLEAYVDVYYGVTRAVSYVFYFFVFGYLVCWIARLIGGRKTTVS